MVDPPAPLGGSEEVGDPAEAGRDIAVRARRATAWVIGACLAAEVAFVVLDYHVNYGRATRIDALRFLANIAAEDGLASRFAAAQTLMVALTLWAIGACTRDDPGTSSAGRRGWFVLAVLFTWMAFDDGAQIHERLGTAFDEVIDSGGDAGAAPSTLESWVGAFPSYFWQIVVLPGLAAAAAIGFALVWRALGARRLRRLVLAGLGCLALAVALDFFEGLDEDHPWNWYTRVAGRFEIEPWTLLRFGRSAYDTVEHFSKSIEEYLEMLGNTLLWLAFLRYLTGLARTLRIRLD